MKRTQTSSNNGGEAVPAKPATKKSNSRFRGVQKTTKTKKLDGRDDFATKSSWPLGETPRSDYVLSIKSEAEIEADHGPVIRQDAENQEWNYPAAAVSFAFLLHVAFKEVSDGFHRFMGNIWKAVAPTEINWAVKRFLTDQAKRKRASKLIEKIAPYHIENVLKFVKDSAPLGEPPPPSQKKLPVANGVLVLSGDKPFLVPYRKDDWFTSQLQVAYNPDAQCPRFLNELIHPALPDPDDVDLLQRTLGSLLISDNAAQRILLIDGEGGSGKSVLISIIEALLGHSRFAHLRIDKQASRFESGFYHDKSVLVAKDVKPNFLLHASASFIKSLTGADWFETEKKFSGKTGMRGRFHVIITSNSRLLVRVEDDAQAWRRRIIRFFFSRKAPAVRIPNFDEVLLREEGEGILAWLVQGCMAYLKELRDHGDVLLTPAQQKRVDDLILESDGATTFVRESLTIGEGDLTGDEIWDRYVEYAVARDWRLPNKQTFLQQLADVMPVLLNSPRSTHLTRNGKPARGYKGVKWA